MTNSYGEPILASRSIRYAEVSIAKIQGKQAHVQDFRSHHSKNENWEQNCVAQICSKTTRRICYLHLTSIFDSPYD